MAPLFLLLLSVALADDVHTEPPRAPAPPAVAPITDARADRLIRDSCQRCHDNARVALVAQRDKEGLPVLPAIRRSANFNLEAANFILDRAVRRRIRNAIRTGGMPFADEFVVDRERIARHLFLDSAEGRSLMAWLEQPAPK